MSDWGKRVRNKIAGVIFGTAIGDALGYPVEFTPINPDEPVVRGYCRYRDGEALYSDDTQMMRAVLEGLIRAGTFTDIDLAAEEIAAEFIAWSRSPENNRSPGRACMLGCSNLAAGRPWREAGKYMGKGCGAAMRSMAYGLWFPGDPDTAAYWAGEHALMTHRSSVAQASAAAVAAAVSEGVAGQGHNVMAASAMRAAERYDVLVCDKMLEAAGYVVRMGNSAPVVLDQYRGWCGDEAIAASLYCFLEHPRSYRDAVLLAVNSPGDSDSLGAITGALSGAYLGFEDTFPPDWVDAIEKRKQLSVLSARVKRATHR